MKKKISSTSKRTPKVPPITKNIRAESVRTRKQLAPQITPKKQTQTQVLKQNKEIPEQKSTPKEELISRKFINELFKQIKDVYQQYYDEILSDCKKIQIRIDSIENQITELENKE